SLQAFYFAHASGYYKVWIGRYASREDAERAALTLLDGGVIREYFVVEGRTFGAAAPAPAGAESRLRHDLVETARSFLNYPYAWGGASAREGFDCSGLTMAVYRLNGLDMPRSLFDQFESGRAAAFDRLGPGDLVFFATGGDEKVSHVGIFIGDGLFIHAPGTNKSIRMDSLSNPYFRMRIVGARSYLVGF
ncbi:MAG: C40 family peptidase, partial [Candidatus Aminicenantales bacterium]